MTGAELTYLAGVAGLSHLEFASPRLTLRTEDARLYAEYAGAYSSGCRWIEQDRSIPTLDIDIDSDKFAHFAGTFPADASIRISQNATSLNLRSRGNNHALRCYPASEHLHFPEAVTPFATCNAAKLLVEVELAADLNAQNKQSAGPIGLNISTNLAKGYCRVMSYNGYSALFLAQIDCEDVAQDMAIVVPAKDFVRGLSLFADGLVELGVSAGRLLLRSDRAWFSSPTENVTWPNFAPMLKRSGGYRVAFRTEQVKGAALSARVLGAASTLELTAGEQGVVLRTLQSEAGSFATAVEGTVSGSFFLGAEDLLFATKMCKDEMVFELAAKRPVMIREARRLLAMQTKAV